MAGEAGEVGSCGPFVSAESLLRWRQVINVDYSSTVIDMMRKQAAGPVRTLARGCMPLTLSGRSRSSPGGAWTAEPGALGENEFDAAIDKARVRASSSVTSLKRFA